MWLMFYPPFLMLFFTILPILLNIVYFSIDNIQVLYLYAFSSFLFIIFYLIAQFFLGNKIVKKHPIKLDVNFKSIYYRVCFIFAVSGFIISLYIIVFEGILKPGDMIYLLRYRHTFLNESTYGSEYLSIFSIVLMIVNIVRKDKKKALLYFIMNITYSLSIGQRTSILFVITVALYWLFNSNQLNIKKTLVIILTFFLLVIIMAISSNKTGSYGHNFIVEYIAYGLSSFSNNIFHRPELDCISIVLGSFSKIFGLEQCQSPIYINNGEFNVFTYMYQPYMYMGVLGVLVVSSLLGFIYGFVYTLRKNYLLINIWCSLSIYPIIMIFYDFQFNLITPIYIVLSFIPFVIVRTKVNQKANL